MHTSLSEDDVDRARELSVSSLSADALRSLLTDMLTIRAVEDEIERLFFEGLVRGSTHLCQGQEAVTVGACRALRVTDTMTCTYRGHGAVLAKGASPLKVIAEILGKPDGLCGGQGGSMHLADAAVGAMGSFAIVGANLPVAVGLGWGHKLRTDGGVSLTFFGDGATNIGAFHEAMNLAAIWELPVIFICENNLYGEYSPIRATTPVENLVERATSYNMRAEQVDGNDVLAMLASTEKAVFHARAGGGPTFLEALTYRQKGHSRSDPGKYRPPDEVRYWLGRDPIALFSSWLIESQVADEAWCEAERRRVFSEIEQVRAAAVDLPDSTNTLIVTWGRRS